MYPEVIGAVSRFSPPFRGKRRIMDMLVPAQGTFHADIFGFRMHLDVSEFIQRMMFLGMYERRETRTVKNVLNPGMTFVDVGANVGYYTAMAATIVGPGGRVVAFEPSPEPFRRLHTWVTSNGATNITIVNAGLSDDNAELVLFVPPEAYHNHDPSVVEYCRDMTSIRVESRRFDEEFLRQGLTRVDLMKVDVEGHEPRVFSGCEDLLRRGQIRRLLCEFNDPLLRRCQSSSFQLLKYLAELGFTADDPSRCDGPVQNLLLSHHSANRP